jgi:hypothetical protein
MLPLTLQQMRAAAAIPLFQQVGVCSKMSYQTVSLSTVCQTASHYA